MKNKNFENKKQKMAWYNWKNRIEKISRASAISEHCSQYAVKMCSRGSIKLQNKEEETTKEDKARRISSLSIPSISTDTRRRTRSHVTRAHTCTRHTQDAAKTQNITSVFGEECINNFGGRRRHNTQRHRRSKRRGTTALSPLTSFRAPSR